MINKIQCNYINTFRKVSLVVGAAYRSRDGLIYLFECQ